MNFGTLKGTLHPGFNIGAKFNILRYSYDARSTLLLLKGIYQHTDWGWLPYISFGVGASFNKLLHYKESAFGDAAPQRRGHRSALTRAVAYSVDIGLYRRPLTQWISFDLAYRFVFANGGALSHPVWGVSSLDSEKLMGHFLSVAFNFG